MLVKFSSTIINTLSISELAALRYIEDNVEFLHNLSIQELSAKAYTSTATILRMAKKLGYSGYSELRFAFLQNYNSTKAQLKDISYREYLDRKVESLKKTLSTIDERTIIKIVNQIKNSNCIYLFGKGVNSTILHYFSKMLFTLGINNVFLEDTHIAYLSLEKATENDILFLLSLSGETHQVVRAALIAKVKKAKIISFTSNSINELSTLSTTSIGIDVDDKMMKPIDLVSRTQFIFIFDLIIHYLSR